MEPPPIQISTSYPNAQGIWQKNLDLPLLRRYEELLYAYPVIAFIFHAWPHFRSEVFTDFFISSYFLPTSYYHN